jgi:hypothetical protein
MSRIITKKRLALGAVTSLLAAAMALAYWTTTGDGTASGDVETGDTAAIALTGALDDDLVPGRTVNLDINADNTDDETHYRVVSTTVDDFALVYPAGHEDAGEPIAGCLESWFDVESTVTQDQTIEAGTAEDLDDDHDVEFLNDSDANQDACKGAAMTFDLSSN